jgi:Holliday junction resolvase RusA-like endonuclease
MIELTFEDAPPGVNNLYTNVPGVGRVLSTKARAWREHAGYQLNRQRPSSFAGPVKIDLAIEDKGRFDLDGCAKIVIDLLVTHGVIEEDNRKIVRDIHLYWDASIAGCRVRVMLDDG